MAYIAMLLAVFAMPLFAAAMAPCRRTSGALRGG
jgi:hypothetical protein